jgi:pimeloyl-ACP methyl ester carboxylesterase
MAKLIFLFAVFTVLTGCSTAKNKKIDDYVFSRKKEKNEYINSYNKALKLWKAPFEEQYVPTKFGKAHIIVSGSKEAKALVLLHGMDASSTMWYPNIESLSKNHRVYAIDFLIEAGKSESPKNLLSKEEIISWYTEIFDHYKLKNYEVVGASRGGWIGTLLAIQENSKMDKLVLLSPAQTFEGIDQINKASSAFFLKLFPNKKKLKKTLEAFAYYPEKINPVYKNQFYLANKYSKTNTSLLQMKPFSEEDLKKIKIPVLVLIGDHDVINSEKSLLRANEFISKAKTETIKNAGHFLSIDQAEDVSKKIIIFLNK